MRRELQLELRLGERIEHVLPLDLELDAAAHVAQRPGELLFLDALLDLAAGPRLLHGALQVAAGFALDEDGAKVALAGLELLLFVLGLLERPARRRHAARYRQASVSAAQTRIAPLDACMKKAPCFSAISAADAGRRGSRDGARYYEAMQAAQCRSACHASFFCARVFSATGLTDIVVGSCKNPVLDRWPRPGPQRRASSAVRTMPTLSLFRHAKSSWDQSRAARLRSPAERARAWRPPRAWAPSWPSTASRRISSCAHPPCARARRSTSCCRTFRRAPRSLYEDAIYLGAASTLLKRVRKLEADVRHAMIVAHDPGLHQLAMELAGLRRPGALQTLAQKFPTAALAVIVVRGGAAGRR